jgi:hypothetical protein
MPVAKHAWMRMLFSLLCTADSPRQAQQGEQPPQQQQQQLLQQLQQQLQKELVSSNAAIAAHRTAEFTVLFPAGATDLKMQLRRPAFIFGTALQPETAPDPEWYENTTAAMFWGECHAYCQHDLAGSTTLPVCSFC